MKKKKISQQYFFVDEAGDPTFYNSKGEYIVGQEGCSKVLLLGFIRTEKPKELRKSLARLHKEIMADEYLKSIPSIAKKTSKGFHAKDDCPEVREKVFKLITQLDFSAEFIVARKIESLFINKHKRKENIFYDDLITHLFRNKLHLAEKNTVYFATRGSKNRQAPLEDAIQVAINLFEEKWDIKNESDTIVYAQKPSDEPCLQIVDYMNWAVQRAFHKEEERYFEFVKDKVSFLLDIYDFQKYPKNFYNRQNAFSLNKISPV